MPVFSYRERVRYVLYSAAAATAAAAVVSWTLIQGSPAAAAKPNVVNGTPSTPDRIQATVPETAGLHFRDSQVETHNNGMLLGAWTWTLDDEVCSHSQLEQLLVPYSVELAQKGAMQPSKALCMTMCYFQRQIPVVAAAGGGDALSAAATAATVATLSST
ncbi:hypothetical protein PG989_001705 [Apiospora arundinis]